MKIVIVLFVLLFLLAGCQQRLPNGLEIDSFTGTELNSTNSVTPTTVIETLTKTPIPHIQTNPTLATRRATATITSRSFVVLSQCIEHVERNDPGFSINSGSLVLNLVGQESGVMLNKKGETQELPSGFIHRVSPINGTILLRAGDQWIFIRSNGKSVQIPINPDYPVFRQWLLKDRVVFMPNIEPKNREFEASDKIAIFSETSGSFTTLRIPMEGNFAHYRIANRDFLFDTIYDPEMKQAVYGWQNNVNDLGLALWDMDRKERVWQSGEFSFIEKTDPMWQLDGSRFVISASLDEHMLREIWIVSKNGDLQQVSSFNKITDQFYDLYSPTWSPDGRYIAYLYNEHAYEQYGDNSLYILDTKTWQTTNYCLHSIAFNSLTWSPDSKQIAFIQEKTVVVLDLEMGHAQKFMNSSHLYGWVNWEMPK
jgi:hypothetical protein